MVNRFQAARIPVASSVWMSYGIPENQHEENGSQCTILPPKNSNYSYFFSFCAQQNLLLVSQKGVHEHRKAFS